MKTYQVVCHLIKKTLHSLSHVRKHIGIGHHVHHLHHKASVIKTASYVCKVVAVTSVATGTVGGAIGTGVWLGNRTQENIEQQQNKSSLGIPFSAATHFGIFGSGLKQGASNKRVIAQSKNNIPEPCSLLMLITAIGLGLGAGAVKLSRKGMRDEQTKP